MRCHDRWRRCRGAGARPTAAVACCSMARSSSRACLRRLPRSCTSCCFSLSCSQVAQQLEQQQCSSGCPSRPCSGCRRCRADFCGTSRTCRTRCSSSCDKDHQDFQQCLDSCPTCTSSFLSTHAIFRLPHDALRWSTLRDEFDAARHAHPGARGHQREHRADPVFPSHLTFCNSAGTPGGARA